MLQPIYLLHVYNYIMQLAFAESKASEIHVQDCSANWKHMVEATLKLDILAVKRLAASCPAFENIWGSRTEYPM